MDGFVFIILLIVGFVIYFIPGFVASNRKTKNEQAVWVINLFLGWSLIGWVIALAMAVSGESKQENRTPQKNRTPQNKDSEILAVIKFKKENRIDLTAEEKAYLVDLSK